MPAPRPAKMVYPEGADESLLRRLQRRAVTERNRLFQAEHKAFLRESESKSQMLRPLVDRLGIEPEEVARAFARKRESMKKMLLKEKPPAFEPLAAHNPVRYAPFDMPWAHINCGGITYCKLYGPTASSGRIGASLGVFNGGGASSVGSVGFWYRAQEERTLHITVQASVWGKGYVFSGLFGYASAYAGLRAYIERYSSDFKVYKATTDIYDNWGVLECDVKSFDWVTRTVSINVPLRRATWYAIWADAVQSAYAGGIADSVSNFCMYVGPVSYYLL